MSDWKAAVRAAQSKKAEDIVVLNVSKSSSFTETFVICTGTNSRQVQTIADAIEMALKADGARAIGIEGYTNGSWVLMDYGGFVVHVFLPDSRQFYDLERLWKHAPRMPVPEAA